MATTSTASSKVIVAQPPCKVASRPLNDGAFALRWLLRNQVSPAATVHPSTQQAMIASVPFRLTT